MAISLHFVFFSTAHCGYLKNPLNSNLVIENKTDGVPMHQNWTLLLINAQAPIVHQVMQSIYSFQLKIEMLSF